MQEDLHLPGRLRFGVFELDLRSGELRKRDLRVRLQEQPFQLLAILLGHPGEVTREELRKKLWPADTFVDFDHGLNKAISKLREALSDSAESPRFVETVARRSYRFLAEVKVVDTVPVRSPEDVTQPHPTAEARRCSPGLRTRCTFHSARFVESSLFVPSESGSLWASKYLMVSLGAQYLLRKEGHDNRICRARWRGL